MSDVAATLKAMYLSATAREPESRVINAWARAIDTKSKTVQDFAESLTNQPEYRSVIESRYKTRFGQLVPDVEPSADDFAAFWARCERTRVLSDRDIDEFVKGQDAYRLHQEEMVKRVVDIVAPDIDASIIRTFVDRMIGASGDEYTLEHVHAELEAMLLSSQHDDKKLTSVLDSECEFGREFGRKTYDGPVTATDTMDVTTCDTRHRNRMKELSQKLEAFESAFGRRMYVEEYVEHGDAFLDQSVDVLKKASSAFTKSYNRVREVYADYADIQDFQEYDFVKRHLHEHDRPGFVDALTQDLLSRETYQDGMCRKLQALYTELYDDTLDAASLMHVFNRVRQSGIGLHDEQLVPTIQDFKKETDMILENVFYVYMAVYARSPEFDEQQRHVDEYRVELDSSSPISAITDAANARLMERLIQTLEFHDVVKNKIRLVWSKCISPSTNPSSGALYQVLERVLTVLGTCTTLAAVDDVVERMVRDVAAV